MNNRVKEIITAIQPFSKEAYMKKELLPEYFELEKKLVNLTFNDIHAEKGNLRIWDVENHLEKLNDECGHPADTELEEFKEGCKFISNAIKSECSGQAGENKAFRSLETMRCKNKIIKNVELSRGNHRTEIDALVFTEKAIFIIEVKNPHRDIYIDERGNYCRVGNTIHLESNIGEKMNEKTFLLKEALKSEGIEDNNIVSLVVFTNSIISVDNRYEFIKISFLSTLPHIIENYCSNNQFTDYDIDRMIVCVKKAECKEAYPPKFDFTQFKLNFATLMSKLEEASEKRSEDNPENVSETIAKKSVKATIPITGNNFASKNLPVFDVIYKAVGALAVFVLGFATAKYICKKL